MNKIQNRIDRIKEFNRSGIAKNRRAQIKRLKRNINKSIRQSARKQIESALAEWQKEYENFINLY